MHITSSMMNLIYIYMGHVCAETNDNDLIQILTVQCYFSAFKVWSKWIRLLDKMPVSAL